MQTELYTQCKELGIWALFPNIPSFTLRIIKVLFIRVESIRKMITPLKMNHHLHLLLSLYHNGRKKFGCTTVDFRPQMNAQESSYVSFSDPTKQNRNEFKCILEVSLIPRISRRRFSHIVAMRSITYHANLQYVKHTQIVFHISFALRFRMFFLAFNFRPVYIVR